MFVKSAVIVYMKKILAWLCLDSFRGRLDEQCSCLALAGSRKTKNGTGFKTPGRNFPDLVISILFVSNCINSKKVALFQGLKLVCRDRVRSFMKSVGLRSCEDIFIAFFFSILHP